jgi:hypothetical protein
MLQFRVGLTYIFNITVIIWQLNQDSSLKLIVLWIALLLPPPTLLTRLT